MLYNRLQHRPACTCSKQEQQRAFYDWVLAGRPHQSFRLWWIAHRHEYVNSRRV